MRLTQLTESQMRYGSSENLLGSVLLCLYEGAEKTLPAATIAAQRFPGSEAVMELAKAAQAPAATDVPAYAGALNKLVYAELQDALRAAAILPQCVPLAQQHEFNGAASIWVPTRTGGPTDLAGSFRAEGSPIPVRGTTFGHVTLTPKNLGVIVHASVEMLSRSSIDLASYFERAIAADTAAVLDELFVSDSPATPISPAGARAGLAPGDTRVSSGATVANIAADIGTMMAAMTAQNMGGPATRWIMHPSNLVALNTTLGATGAAQFPETGAGRLGLYPVLTSTTMSLDIVLLVDFAQFSFAAGKPEFLASSVATFHEESETPLPISTAGTPNVVSAPVRSLYQTNSWALRMMLDADWAKLRTSGLVQELTSVAWV